jgi:hypothetical protein
MPHQRVIANITAAIVLLPTTLFAVVGSWLFFSLFYAALRGASYVGLAAASIGALTAALGYIGVITLWILYFHLCRAGTSFRPHLLHWLGLAAGVIASLLLMFWVMAETPWPNRLVYGWPLLGAATFVAMLLRKPSAA